MRRYIVKTEGLNRLGLRELCERWCNEQWTAAHCTPQQAADILRDQFVRVVKAELEMLEVECVE
jgi:hypothetical protein